MWLNNIFRKYLYKFVDSHFFLVTWNWLQNYKTSTSRILVTIISQSLHSMTMIPINFRVNSIVWSVFNFQHESFNNNKRKVVSSFFHVLLFFRWKNMCEINASSKMLCKCVKNPAKNTFWLNARMFIRPFGFMVSI